MQASDYDAFDGLLQAVAAMYGRDLTPGLMALYWQGLRAYDLAGVREALNRHLHNPDTGQFMPKIADIRRMLDGSSQEAALLAWSKVERAAREVGPYRSVVFGDALIHRVLYEMEGWIGLGTKTDEHWPFVRNEFVNRYRGYRMRGETPDYPPVIIGLTEAQNTRTGWQSDPPLLIGEVEAAKRVMRGGVDKPLLGFTRLEAAKVAPLHLAERAA